MSPTETVRRLNWGCGGRGTPGWINSDVQRGEGIDISEDIRGGLSIESSSVDYIVSIHALPMIAYPDLVPVLCELRRILKPAGVLRLALPDLDKGVRAYLEGDFAYFLVPDDALCSLGGKFIVHMLWYGHSASMFTTDFVEELLAKAGFESVRHCGYCQTFSEFPGITELDDRETESLFVEATKPAGPSAGAVSAALEPPTRVCAMLPDSLTSGLKSIACRTRREFDRMSSLACLRHHDELLDHIRRAATDGEHDSSREGFCLVCDEATSFESVFQRGAGQTMWARQPERLRCPKCGMDDRERAMYWFAVETVGASRPEIYVTGHVDVLAQQLRGRFGSTVVSSAHLDRGPPEADDACVAATPRRLPFPDQRFDLVVSIDVLGRVRDPVDDLHEICRVLRPGGQLLLTVPFAPDQETNTADDLTTNAGAAFGWEFVDDLRESFPVVTIELYQSWLYGHLGSQVFFRCIR